MSLDLWNASDFVDFIRFVIIEIPYTSLSLDPLITLMSLNPLEEFLFLLLKVWKEQREIVPSSSLGTMKIMVETLFHVVDLYIS